MTLRYIADISEGWNYVLHLHCTRRISIGDLIDDWLVALISLVSSLFTPVSIELLDGSSYFIHVKSRGRSDGHTRILRRKM